MFIPNFEILSLKRQTLNTFYKGAIVIQQSNQLTLYPFLIGLDKQIFERKIVNIFLPISFNICFSVLKRNVSMRWFF